MTRRKPKKDEFLTTIAQMRQHLAMLRMHENERQRREALQREHESQYRHAAELSPDAIIIHRDGRIIFANAACARMLRAATPANLQGKDVFDFLHPEIENIVQERDRQMIEEGIRVSWIKERVVRTDGSHLDCEIVATPFFCDGTSAIQVIMRDISNRHRTGRSAAA